MLPVCVSFVAGVQDQNSPDYFLGTVRWGILLEPVLAAVAPSVPSPHPLARITSISKSRIFLRSVMRLTPSRSAARIWLPRVAASAAGAFGLSNKVWGCRVGKPRPERDYRAVERLRGRRAALRIAALMRLCQPGPPARKWASTSGSSRRLTAFFACSDFGRPTLLAVSDALRNAALLTRRPPICGTARAKSSLVHSGFSS